jgi:enolase
MKKWKKIVGGTACGIACMVALPVLAPIGAITVAGTLIGGSLGGITAFMAGDDDEAAAEARGETRGRSKAKAEYDIKLEQYDAADKRRAAHVTAQLHHFDVMLALVGVGMACAGASAAESNTAMAVKEFACGQALAHLPAPVLHMIELTVNNPTDLQSAYLRACMVAPGDMEIFDEMVQLVASLDAPFASVDHAAVWRQLRAA